MSKIASTIHCEILLEMAQRNIKNRIRFAFIGMLSLHFGLLLYLIYNQDAIISRWIYSFLRMRPFKKPETLWDESIRCWGADLLWMLSFTLFVQALLNISRKKHFYLLFCILLGITYEILQYAGLAIGTADVGDIVAYALGNLFAIVIIKCHKEVREKKQTIRLISCDTGKDVYGFAQQLANKLNTTVVAPTRKFLALENGGYVIAGTKKIGDITYADEKDIGYMKVFRPGGAYRK